MSTPVAAVVATAALVFLFLAALELHRGQGVLAFLFFVISGCYVTLFIKYRKRKDDQ